MQQCSICNKRPAKRFCPALNSKICAICCARDRMLEIACPESCTYLQSAREHSNRAQVVHKVATQPDGPPGLKQSQIAAMMTLEEVIVATHRQALKNLRDQDVLSALENARKNLETAQSGLIYEDQHSDRIVRELSAHLREGVLEKAKGLPEQYRPSMSDIVAAIGFSIELVKFYISGEDGPSAYLRAISLGQPWPAQDKAGPLIVLP